MGQVGLPEMNGEEVRFCGKASQKLLKISALYTADPVEYFRRLTSFFTVLIVESTLP